MSKKAGRCLLWFTVGQIVQILLNVLSRGNGSEHPLAFCGSAGFLILVAVFAGVRLATVEENRLPWGSGRHV